MSTDILYKISSKMQKYTTFLFVSYLFHCNFFSFSFFSPITKTKEDFIFTSFYF